MKPVIFTDLDGTLLDARTYSFEPAEEALALLKKARVPLVICTSKTRAEILYWRDRLGNHDPFVCENGGAVYVPDGYFPFNAEDSREAGGYHVTEFGAAYRTLREALVYLRAQGFDVKGFGDMTPEEVAGLTGLTAEQAALAMEREYDEPFVLEGGEAPDALMKSIEGLGLRYTKGRLMHILGDDDKGRAVVYLAGLYGRAHGAVVTAALGDSENDAPMLAEVDYPFLVGKPDGSHERKITDMRVVRMEGAGPVGWAQAVTAFLKGLGLV